MVAKHCTFSEGCKVEVSSDEPGFLGAWFEATVSRVGKGGERVSVDYDRFVDEKDESKLHREVVDVSHVRPRPPCQSDACLEFKPGDMVEALVTDGWWSGEIAAVLDNSEYVVEFPDGDSLEIAKSHLRSRLDWVEGKWVSPGSRGSRHCEEQGEKKRRKRMMERRTSGDSLGNMLIATFVKGLSKLKINDPLNSFAQRLKTLDALESRGCDVHLVRARLLEMSSLKRRRAQYVNNIAELEAKILKQKHVVAGINLEIAEISQNLALEHKTLKQENEIALPIPPRIANLNSCLGQLIRQRDFGIMEVSALRKDLLLYRENCQSCESDFVGLAAFRWVTNAP